MLAALTLTALTGLALATPSSNALHTLVSRQALITPEDIPEQCSGQCTPMADTLNECITSSDPTCGCDSTTQGQVEACFGCLVELLPSLKDQMDQALEAYTQGCASAASASTATGTAVGSGSAAAVPTATSPSGSGSSSTSSSPNSDNSSSGDDSSSNPVQSESSESNTDAAASVHPTIFMAVLAGALAFGGAFMF